MLRINRRRGVATVELAVCLPVIVLLVLGGIEAVNAIFLKQGLTIAAYETVKVASTVGGVAANAKSRGESILNARGFNGAAITVNPQVDATTPRGTLVTVTATAPMNQNAMVNLVSFQNAVIRAQIAMVRN